MAVSRRFGPGDQRIGLGLAAVGNGEHIDAARRQRPDTIEQRLIAAGTEDFGRAHRQRQLRGIQPELAADAVDQNVCPGPTPIFFIAA